MIYFTKNPIFFYGGGGVIFCKLTRNPDLIKYLFYTFAFFFFFFFFFGGGGEEGGGKGGGG